MHRYMRIDICMGLVVCVDDIDGHRSSEKRLFRWTDG